MSYIPAAYKGHVVYNMMGDVVPPEPSTITKIAGPLVIFGLIYWIWAGKPSRTRSTYRGSRR